MWLNTTGWPSTALLALVQVRRRSLESSSRRVDKLGAPRFGSIEAETWMPRWEKETALARAAGCDCQRARRVVRLGPSAGNVRDGRVLSLRGGESGHVRC